MESQPQNPELRINHENFHPCDHQISFEIRKSNVFEILGHLPYYNYKHSYEKFIFSFQSMHSIADFCSTLILPLFLSWRCHLFTSAAYIQVQLRLDFFYGSKHYET